MKLHRFFLFSCVIIISFLSLGCENDQGRLMFAIDDSLLADDVDVFLPEISPTSNDVQARYRVRVRSADINNGIITKIISYLGDFDAKVKVVINLNPAPYSHTIDGKSAIGVKAVNDAYILDVVVVEITKVITETSSHLEYEGVIQKNLSRPDVEFRYPEDQ